MPGEGRRRRASALGLAGAVLGAAVVFVCALVVGTLVHTGTPAMRRLAVSAADRALAGSFRGRVQVQALKRFGLEGVEGLAAVAYDPVGREVARVQDANARIDLPALAWSAALGRGPIPIVLRDVRIRDVDVNLVPDASGRPTLPGAFEPATPSNPQGHGAPSRGVRVEVESFRVERARVHGALAPFEAFDARATGLSSSFAHDDASTTARVRRLDLEVTGVAPQRVLATVRADVVLPARGERVASAHVEGHVGEIPLSFDGSIHGERIEARLDLQGTRDAVRHLAPQLAFAAPLSAHAEVHGDLSAPSGSARVDATGVSLDARAQLRRRGERTLVDFEAHGASELSRMRPLRPGGLHGAARLDSTGRVDLGQKTIEGRVELQGADVAVGKQSLRRVRAWGRVQGRLSAPLGHLTVEGERVRLGGRTFDEVRVRADGPLRAPKVAVTARGPRLPNVAARASLSFEDGLGARRAVVELSRGGAVVVASVDRLRAAAGAIDATGIEVQAAGSPLRGEAHVRSGTITLRLATAGMDITPILGVAGASSGVRGELALDLDVRAGPTGATGYLNGRWDSTGRSGERPRSASAALTLAGRRIEGDVLLAFGNLEAHAAVAPIVLAGPPDDAQAWRRATGTVNVESEIPLAALEELVPAEELPFREMSGLVSIKAHIVRRGPDAVPDATIDASTRGLALRGKAPTELQPSYTNAPEQARAPKHPWRLEGVDLSLAASVEGDADRVALQGRLMDRAGQLARLDVDARPDLRRLIAGRAQWKELLLRAPLAVHVDVGEREISTLPPSVRPAALRGRLRAIAELGGRLDDPRLKLQARGLGVQATESRSAMPFDAILDATYDGRAVIARAIVSRPEGVVLDARSDVDVRIADVLAPPAAGVPWDGGATVALHAFPVNGIVPVAARGLGGIATGVVALEGLHRDGRLDADLRIEKPQLGEVCFESGRLRARADGRYLAASASLERPNSQIAASIRAANRWGDALVPGVDTSRPVDVALDATNFRAAALMPLLRASVNQLDGRIDANARIHVDPDFKTGTMNGDVRFSNGVVEVPALGERLHDVTATAFIRPWGTLRFEGITASGTSGMLKASATALLDGLRLRSATADVEIPQDKPMPLTVEGVSLGEASGRFRAEARMSPDVDQLDVAVTVERLEMRLLHSSGHAVQSLEPAPQIVVGMYQPDGQFVALPLHAPQKPREPGAMAVRVAVSLGRDVRVRRDANLDVELTGQPVLEVTDAPRVNGTINVIRGYVDVFGKRFTIEPASTFSFTGDSSNPQLVVTARYDAPDGTRIYADAVGPLKKPKISVRSEPALSQDEILGLLVFGSQEGLAGAPPPDQQPDPTQRAAGLASGPLTEALNKALSGITSLDVTTRVDTSQAANPRPELEVRVSSDVLARVTVQTGMPAPGEPPDRTLLTVDWRFKPRWSVQSTVGDEGSTFIDLLWHHRY